MPLPNRIIKEIDKLNDTDRQIVLEKINEKYMADNSILLNENHSWWDNEEDDIYNAK